jgi:type II secretory ATPase GspE/PulE/Tfp pilus assembly ATPase PilB-like protein
VNTWATRGASSILELLKFDAALDELVTQRASLKVMTDHVRSRICHHGRRRFAPGARRGITTVEEVGRVADLTELIL